MILVPILLCISFVSSFYTWIYMKCTNNLERTRYKRTLYNIHHYIFYYILNAIISYLLWKNVYIIYENIDNPYKENVIFISLMYIIIYISMNFKYYITMLYNN